MGGGHLSLVPLPDFCISVCFTSSSSSSSSSSPSSSYITSMSDDWKGKRFIAFVSFTEPHTECTWLVRISRGVVCGSEMNCQVPLFTYIDRNIDDNMT